MDVTLGSVFDGIQKVGFPVAIAAAALWVCWKLALRSLEKLEKRLEDKEKECAAERVRFERRLDEKEAAHAAERKTHSDAHLTAIGALTTTMAQHNRSIDLIGENVRELARRRAVGD